MIGDARTDLLVEPFSSADLAGAIQRVLRSGDTLGSQAARHERHERLARICGYPAVAQKLLNVYESVVDDWRPVH
jgi:hypothetical protein